jgi:hypothetical protein
MRAGHKSTGWGHGWGDEGMVGERDWKRCALASFSSMYASKRNFCGSDLLTGSGSAPDTFDARFRTCSKLGSGHVGPQQTQKHALSV